MRQRSTVLIISLTFAWLLFSFLWQLLMPPALAQDPPPAATAPLDAELQAAIDQAAPTETLRFILHLRNQATLTNLPQTATKAEQGAWVVQQLQATAVASQPPVLDQLQTLSQEGAVASYRPLWIINAIAAAGTPAAIHALAARPEIAEVRLDSIAATILPPEGDALATLLQQPALAIAPDTAWGVQRIRAPHTWHGLGVDGSGITVGIMDTGVDYTHPDLVNSYRGNLGNGTFNHTGNWYNTTVPTNTFPTDLFGHGTHVAGTAVGQNGIGVAPGARWIAVNIANQYGSIYDSDAHAGFEWLLAPAGNPALAPDVVNGSWGGRGAKIEFVPDIQALRAAGIIPVFAMGNSGPFEGSIGSPASYAQTLAVGASDDIDEAGWFSSRGPSPLTNAVKPLVIAPGTAVYSALPGDQYGYYSGTSMAAPHTSGTVALLLSADPTLTYEQITQILAQTAVPISTTHPNMESGWGRLDAYAALQPQRPTGRLAGTVAAGGAPLPHIPVTITTPGGFPLTFETDANGYFEAHLFPGVYQLTVHWFGYQVYTAVNLPVSLNQTLQHPVNLTPLPRGTIWGTVYNVQTGEPLPGAEVEVAGTPVTAVANNNGLYAVSLPAGQYRLIARERGYRLEQAVLQPVIGGSMTRHFSMESGPTNLLIDSGQWYYRSQAAYFEEALTGLEYQYDKVTIRHPFRNMPSAHTLSAYDHVIWTAPDDSPGRINANQVITSYLGQGGNFLVSGQNVGLYDGYGFNWQIWWVYRLDGQYVGKTVFSQTISGADGTHFAGLNLQLNGPDTAQNQVWTDVAESRPNRLTEAAFTYEYGAAAGLQAGICHPYRIVYLGFGLEGVSGAANREEVVQRSFDYFASPRQENGLRFMSEDLDEFAIPGAVHVYTFTIQNLSETITDTFNLDLYAEGWEASLVTPTLTLGPCETGQTVLRLRVPPQVAKDTHHLSRITAVSQNNPALTRQLTVHHKTPGQILFVDDDRWYNEEAHITGPLDAMGLAYDVWSTGWQTGERRGSPPTALLHEYDFIIWYTGYDWHTPVRPEEAASLEAYLAQGGRLFLTSQDFLYYHHNTPLARQYLGVLDYRESVTPTIVYGGNHPANGPDVAGPLPLSRGAYLNDGDGLVPTGDGRPFFWHNSGAPAGVARAGPTWRSLFWGISFEMLPDEREVDVMNQIMGWLSDLGDSAVAVDARTGPATAARTFTITLQNSTLAPNNQVYMTNTLPASLTLVPGTLLGPAVYDAANHRLTWSGSLMPGQVRQITYQALPAPELAPGTAVTNPVSIGYARHHLTFERAAVFWVQAPDLAASTFTAVPHQPLSASEVTYRLVLENSGLAATAGISAVVRLPDELRLLTGTLVSTAGIAWLDDQALKWEGDLQPGETVILTVRMDREETFREQWLPATAVILDGVTPPILKEHILHLPAYKQYFPLTIQN